MRTLTCLGLLALIASPAAFADEGTDHWSGSGELGIASAKGNTDSQTFVGKLGLKKQAGPWAYGMGGQFLYTKNDGEESANRYEAFLSAARDLSPRSYLNSVARTQHDHFATYAYQHTVSVNYGFRAIDTDRTRLVFEIGPGYRWSKLQDRDERQNELIARGYSDFSHRLTDSTSLVNTLLIESGSDNTYIADDIGLQVQMSKALALKVGYQIHHNTETYDGSKRTDTLTTANVVYNF